MAVELQIQLKQASDGAILSLSEGEILRVTADTLGADVVYYKHGMKREITVTETPDKVAGLTKSLIKLTDDDSATQHINADKIILIDDREDGKAGSMVKYDDEGAYPKYLIVSETKGAINKAIYEAAGNTAYTIDAINFTNKTFTLTTANGDVTATFLAGKIFSVIDSTGNDGTYEVASSTTSGGKTVITVKEAIPDQTVDGNILIVTTG